MFPRLDEFRTESDVEQKLIWPLLTSSYPNGLSYFSSDIVTKLNIRRLEIGKGAGRKLYYPDYLVIIAGLPVLVIEAKARGESLSDALDEARLYANEINALFPSGINPCGRVIACNGDALWTAATDSGQPDCLVSHDELSPGNLKFASFVDICRRQIFQVHADAIRKKLRKKEYRRPVTMIGGSAFQFEELPQNTFGATIAGDYGHLFNPKTKEDRQRIAQHAYIASLRRQRYVEPIDRLIRNAVAPSAAKIRPIEDSGSPREIVTALRDHKKLENQILLLVGSVGAGKSTFVDYLSMSALPTALREQTVWLRLNLNNAPLSVDRAYEWTAQTIVEEFRDNFADIDFDELEILNKLFSRELSAFVRGPLAVLDPSSVEYRVRLSDRIAELQSDNVSLAKAMSRYLCQSPNRLLVVVLDNCDKRNRDDQLTMFQLAQWVQSEFHCLVVLPIRDVTFDRHRNEPPLDTALKQFVFRIEPPPFSDVLQARVRLALDEIARNAGEANMLSYILPNGARVSYPAKDQAIYLASILRSLYAHDRFVRQVMTGLAGRNVRLALEIFLDFCMSGHIGEDEIYKIMFFEGQHVLPLSLVARVLLRMSRRFYDGNHSYIKNLVQCDPEDPLPDNFVRLTMLHWFQRKLRIKGPAGVEGFHRAADMISDLAALGHDALRVRLELEYLVREECLVAEHLRSNAIADGDLLKITASGMVHLQLMASPEYLAACAEDTWIADQDLCKRIAERISRGALYHYSPLTTARNAQELVNYLVERSGEFLRESQHYLAEDRTGELYVLGEAEAGIAAAEIALPDRLYVGQLPFEVTELELRQAFEARGVNLSSITLPRDATGRNKGFAFV